MADIELYVIPSREHAESSESDALIDFLSDESQCANCNTVVGFLYNKFFPCVVCVQTADEEDDEDAWVVCFECAAAVITPGE